VDTVAPIEAELADAVAAVARVHDLAPAWLNDASAPLRPQTFVQADCEVLLDRPRLLVGPGRAAAPGLHDEAVRGPGAYPRLRRPGRPVAGVRVRLSRRGVLSSTGTLTPTRRRTRTWSSTSGASSTDSTTCTTSAPPLCPARGTDAAIKRDGTYGPKGESLRLQKYRCTPNDAAEKAKYPKGVHYFTPPRAREHVYLGMDHCAECEEFRGVHRGQQVVARRQSWNLRVVAEGPGSPPVSRTHPSAAGPWTARGKAVPGRRSCPPPRRSAARQSRRCGRPYPSESVVWPNRPHHQGCRSWRWRRP
jgi:hypothetical protein